MAYIQPNSTVEFFGDLGISPNYENTLYFANESAKTTYFNNLTPITTATSLSYQREHRGFIRVEKPMSLMYNVGYMRFKNTSFENKWFYAFVTKVNYINNITTEVEFELDVLMTWMGVFSLKQCFIERQHSETDAIGDNIIDEGIPCGDFKDEFVASSGFIGSSGFWYCFASTFDPDNPTTASTGTEYGGIYSGVKYSYTNSITTLNTWITNATTAGKSDGIVGIAIVPFQFITDANDEVVEKAQTFNKPYTNVNGYVPKNKKLFIYPYKSLQVTNLEGNFGEFRYEFFGGTVAQFEFLGMTGLTTEIICCPINYKGVQSNITEKMSMSDFPMCTYNIDAFKAWLAQNKSSIAANVFSSVASTAGGLITGGASLASAVNQSAIYPNISDKYGVQDLNSLARHNLSGEAAKLRFGANMASTGLNLSGNIAQVLGQLADYSRKPHQAGGSQGTSALFGRTTGRQKKDFWFVGKTITAQYAKIIDDYFSMFGYKQNTVGTPNMNVRPNWTYVKTLGCTVEGNLPTDDAKQIENIFDNGIRFWKNHNNIGNYSLNNSPA